MGLNIKEFFTQVYNSSITPIAIACILSTVLFATLIIYISKHPQKRTMPLKIAFILMFIGGIIFYCTCHYLELEQVRDLTEVNRYMKWVKEGRNSSWYKIPYVIIMSVLDVGTMFYGRNNSDVFYNLSLSRDPMLVMVFWLLHLITFYTTATALLVRFGNDLLRWIRIMTSQKFLT